MMQRLKWFMTVVLLAGGWNGGAQSIDQATTGAMDGVRASSVVTPGDGAASGHDQAPATDVAPSEGGAISGGDTTPSDSAGGGNEVVPTGGGSVANGEGTSGQEVASDALAARQVAAEAGMLATQFAQSAKRASAQGDAASKVADGIGPRGTMIGRMAQYGRSGGSHQRAKACWDMSILLQDYQKHVLQPCQQTGGLSGKWLQMGVLVNDGHCVVDRMWARQLGTLSLRGSTLTIDNTTDVPVQQHGNNFSFAKTPYTLFTLTVVNANCLYGTLQITDPKTQQVTIKKLFFLRCCACVQQRLSEMAP